MKKDLVVELKQHTPLIHFQYYQENSTLRASEVKPRLDRYILETLGNGNYKDGCEQASKNGWIIGEKALKYKLRIKPCNKVDIAISNDFPLVLSNIGNNNGKIVDFSMYDKIILTFTIFDESLFKKLLEESDSIKSFFMNRNFGQRDNKGFGSFSVFKFQDIIVDDLAYINRSVVFADFSLGEKFDTDDFFNNQLTLFNVINGLWKKIKKNCKSIPENRVCSYKSYIAFMKLSQNRVPAPILFKPRFYKEDGDLKVSIYIMPDIDLINRLKEDYPNNNTLIENRISLCAREINDIDYIYDMFDDEEFIFGQKIEFYDNND